MIRPHARAAASSSRFRAAWSRTPLLALALIVLLVVAGCSDSDDAATTDDEPRAVDPAGQTDADEQPSSDAPAPDADAPPAGELPRIEVTSPKSFATLVGAMKLAGKAQAFEATINWAIMDHNEKPLKKGFITASCGAPCRGDFSERISLKGVPLGSWELRVWEPNASDEGPARLHEVMVPITISDQRIPGAPEPDAMPPGGVPE
ncbi:MAG: Gmad2 immunoglobulin-like domain-containing protein [Gaiellales bacterium]